MGLISEDSRNALANEIGILAINTDDSILYSYSKAIRFGCSNLDGALFSLIRTLAENRKYLLEREHKRLVNMVDPPIIHMDLGKLNPLDFRPGSIQVVQKVEGFWWEAVTTRELFQELFRRLTRRLRSWYKGR